ncbi:hypothetical protein EXIGLDRAFT_450899 [Exidia glandulosa HHB12029]|uniref:Uncharacterized protein n=1 Tax=Exidia glandulosa HHB12029 TaxID=1314781 RepID=A0A165B460_EXIGL|nr:hypothetical protein EXIGLDRAFT_450899 [Exidia glandulosa HHB12029]
MDSDPNHHQPSGARKRRTPTPASPGLTSPVADSDVFAVSPDKRDRKKPKPADGASAPSTPSTPRQPRASAESIAARLAATPISSQGGSTNGESVWMRLLQAQTGVLLAVKGRPSIGQDGDIFVVRRLRAQALTLYEQLSEVLELPITSPSPALDTTPPAPSSPAAPPPAPPAAKPEPPRASPDAAVQAQQRTSPHPPPPPKPRPPEATARPRVRPVARHRTRSPPNQPRPATRVITRFPDVSTLKGRPERHPATLQGLFNDALGGDWVAAVGFSHQDQLLLYPAGPFTAEQLAARSDPLWKVIKMAYSLSDSQRPVFEPDDSWHKIVLHRVPVPPNGDVVGSSKDFFADIRRSNGLLDASVKQERYLCRQEELSVKLGSSSTTAVVYVSVLLSLTDAAAAGRLLRSGAFCHGTLCRVSRYRPRRRD